MTEIIIYACVVLILKRLGYNLMHYKKYKSTNLQMFPYTQLGVLKIKIKLLTNILLNGI